VRQEEETLLLARLAEDRPEVAVQLLEPVLEEARALGRGHCVLQIQVLLVLAQEARGNSIQAKETLREAVSMAQPQGYVRLFLEEGEAMERLLHTLLPDLREQAQVAYVHTLLGAFPQARASDDGHARAEVPRRKDLLTSQEQLVLQLLAEGASNQDIAHQLVIELSTARKHVSNILSKLEAKNRTQAVARARKWDLL
jgi:LuxR family maltose regulon positive regulatory protein